MGLVAYIVGRFSPLLNSPCHLARISGRGNRAIGDFGEKVASRWLIAQDCVILARNFKTQRGGEVDIIAKDPAGQLLFTEVKTRRAGTKIRGLAAVNLKKQKLIERGANAWLKRLRHRNIPWRFDVIEIELAEGDLPKVLRIENVFQSTNHRKQRF